MSSTIKLLATLAAALVLSGCAAGHKIDYRTMVPIIPMEPSPEKLVVEVAAVDQRPYILAGKKRPHFVGVSRALYYNPYSITTASGLSLGSDLQSAMMAGLSRNFVEARLSFNASRASEPGARLLVLTFREWKADIYMSPRFDYDVTVDVKDEAGSTLATSSAKGSGAIANYVASGSEVLRQLIGDPEVVAALQGAPTPMANARSAAVSVQTPSNSVSGQKYDECMKRVLRISHSQLRLQAMSACDSAN